jgi:denticleless
MDFEALGTEGQPTLPFALKFGRTAGSAHRFAVADEEGCLALFELCADDPSSHALKQHWEAHKNAIFDVAWLADDRQVVTAGGDQTVRVWDVEHRQSLCCGHDHTGSVKSVATRACPTA